MIPINPLSGALIQSTQLQLQQAADKSKQARRQQELAKNIATDEEETENQIENSEELTPIHEENRRQDNRRKQQQHKQAEEETEETESSRLDLKA
jgi:hypothetical protein